MAKPSRATQKKRSREIKQAERKSEKQEQKALRKAARAESPRGGEGDIDPDLIGIFPGPQPPQAE